jgi:hypothetical protein
MVDYKNIMKHRQQAAEYDKTTQLDGSSGTDQQEMKRRIPRVTR